MLFRSRYARRENPNGEGELARRGFNTEQHTIIQSFRSMDDIKTAVHEFLHQRDRASNHKSWGSYIARKLPLTEDSVPDGYLHNSKQVDELAQYTQKFAHKIESGVISSKAVFGASAQISASSLPELIARIHTEFLMGDETFKTVASGLKIPSADLNFYDSLAKYYGSDPLAN